MNWLTLFMLIAVTTFDFFASGDYWGQWKLLPDVASFAPEVLGAAAALVVVASGSRTRFQFVRPAYWVVFAMLSFSIIAGIVMNRMEAGPVIAGLRLYLRAIPWFLLPAVIDFNERELRQQLSVLLAVGILQVPFAVQQRLTSVAMEHQTGDYIFGTLMGSGTLTVFLVCGLCVVTAIFLRRNLRFLGFAVAFVLLLLPTTLNETKVTLIILPIGLCIAVYFAARSGRRLRSLAVGAAVVVLSGFAFLQVYAQLYPEWGGDIPLSELLTDRDWWQRYLFSEEEVGTSKEEVGRLDTVLVPFNHMSSDIPLLAFGYGIGNVSQSALGPGFSGQYQDALGVFAATSAGRMLLELGVVGIVLVSVLLILVFDDARSLSRIGGGLAGGLAAGWAAVVVVIAICVPYTDVIAPPSLAFLFWYLSGMVVAARMRATYLEHSAVIK